MTHYIALFATLKVGGRRLAMVDLRAELESEGFAAIETVVSSGTVLFDHEQRPDEGLEEKLRLLMRHRFGMTSPVLVRSRASLAAAIEGNPFAAGGDETAVHTLFLDGPVDPDAFDAMLAGRSGTERIAAGDRALHIDYGAAGGDNRQTAAFIERRLGRQGTARDLRSLKRILAKMPEA